MYKLPAEERYMRDPMFRAIVDAMEHAIKELQLSPTEMREAAMLAVYRFEMKRPFPSMIYQKESK